MRNIIIKRIFAQNYCILPGFAVTSSVVSCKDYDDDINDLQSQINKLATQDALNNMQTTLNSAITASESKINSLLADYAKKSELEGVKTIAEDAGKAAAAAQLAANDAATLAGTANTLAGQAKTAAQTAQETADAAKAAAGTADGKAQQGIDDAKKAMEKAVEAFNKANAEAGAKELAQQAKDLAVQIDEEGTMLLENDDTPVLWRGPMVANILKQFYQEVYWNNVDVMFVDMPPGTSDVPLTLFQSFKLDGIIVVTSPQELVSMIVEKAINMANTMNVKVLGLIENMSYVECPKCHEKMYVFGKSHIDATADKFNLPVLARIPLDPAIAEASDAGTIEDIEVPQIKEAVDFIENL